MSFAQLRSGPLINTYVNYHLITRNMERSINRVEAQPMVGRETAYYLENIGKVKTIEEFVQDERLFRYAMKAHGLQDMAYAKAFMVKVLEEGVSDPNSFSNKLSDKRYLEFAKTYDFAARGEGATTYNPTQKGTVDKYLVAVIAKGINPSSPHIRQEIDYYLKQIPEVKSVDDLMADDRLLAFALAAHGFEDPVDRQFVRQVLEGGIDDPNSLANRQPDERYAKLVETFNFARYGEDTTTINAAQRPTVDKYLRQNLEEDAGKQNEGVRLALYFQRKAGELKSYYEILADPALAEVVRTTLGFPPALAQADIDKQVQMFKERFELEDFKDPGKLEDFLKRFTALWEIGNPSSGSHSSIAALFSQPTEFGISTNLLLTIAQMRR